MAKQDFHGELSLMFGSREASYDKMGDTEADIVVYCCTIPESQSYVNNIRLAKMLCGRDLVVI